MCGDLQARESIDESRELKMGPNKRNIWSEEQELVKGGCLPYYRALGFVLTSSHHSFVALAKNFSVILDSSVSLRSRI